MLTGAAPPAIQPARPASTGTLAYLLHAVASLFGTTRPDARAQTAHFWVLGALVTAGAVVRFWGLGAVGLHGDEETMALAVRGILSEGWPILPSGMFYPRAMTQLYAMALSTSIFGVTEWALRLPSAICGVALIGLSFVVGRRFLRPNWNLAFTATIAFLPDLIIDSQTARMYIFLVTSVMASLACLFAWERTNRTGWLVAAASALIIGIDMHLLAVAVLPMLFLPGLLRGELWKLIYAGIAAVVVAFAFVAIDAWTNAHYPVPPPEFAAELTSPQGQGPRVPPEFALTFDIALWAAGLGIAFLAFYVARAIPVRAAAFASAALLLAGIGLQVALFYHLAALAYLAGVILAVRYGARRVVLRLLILVTASGLLALIHAKLLASTPLSIIKLVGAMVGAPSVWPYVRIAQLSEMAGVLTGALLIWGLYQLARNRRVNDYWLLAALSVWAPVFALGLFAWNVPTRYTAMSLAPMLLCAFAFVQHGANRLMAQIPRLRRLTIPEALAATLTALCAINPASAAAVINAGYRIHPDHDGAAQFMLSQHIAPDDVVLAEDVLQQTYYLGSVDYWLIGKQVARHFVKRVDGGVVDFYTGTPVIATAAKLDELLQENAGKRIYVIGSGENQRDRRRYMRGDELHAALESDRFETVYTGRDGLTRVLRAAPGQATTSTRTSAQPDADAAVSGPPGPSPPPATAAE